MMAENVGGLPRTSGCTGGGARIGLIWGFDRGAGRNVAIRLAVVPLPLTTALAKAPRIIYGGSSNCGIPRLMRECPVVASRAPRRRAAVRGASAAASA